MRYEKYYIGNTLEHKGLFNQFRGKESAPNRVPDGNINMVNETVLNNGITKKAFSDFVFQAPAITVSVNFAQTVFLQEEDFCASVNILILKNDWLKEYKRAGLYIVTLLSKNNLKYNYSCKISKDRLNNTYLVLPTLDTLDENSPYSNRGFVPDFEYMEKYIGELETECINELGKYLTVTGLNDCELTEEDKYILSEKLIFGKESNSKTVVRDSLQIREFKISDLFACSRGTRLIKSERKHGDIPLLTAGVGEGQGVAQFIEKTPKMTLYKNDITIDMFGLVYYHDYEHYGDDNIHFLVNNNFSHKVKLYITTVIEKALNGYSYSNQFRMADLNKLVISLPVKTNENGKPIIDEEYKYHPDGYIPDFEYMEKYIKAIKKLVITDVVLFKDKVIKETKNIIFEENKNN